MNANEKPPKFMKMTNEEIKAKTKELIEFGYRCRCVNSESCKALCSLEVDSYGNKIFTDPSKEPSELEDFYIGSGDSQCIARRMALCWNALVGVPTEDIEELGSIIQTQMLHELKTSEVK